MGILSYKRQEVWKCIHGAIKQTIRQHNNNGTGKQLGLAQQWPGSLWWWWWEPGEGGCKGKCLLRATAPHKGNVHGGTLEHYCYWQQVSGVLFWRLMMVMAVKLWVSYALSVRSQ